MYEIRYGQTRCHVTEMIKKNFWIEMADEIHNEPHAGSKELVAYNKGKLEE